jgi:hypothetical protein
MFWVFRVFQISIKQIHFFKSVMMNLPIAVFWNFLLPFFYRNLAALSDWKITKLFLAVTNQNCNFCSLDNRRWLIDLLTLMRNYFKGVLTFSFVSKRKLSLSDLKLHTDLRSYLERCIKSDNFVNLKIFLNHFIQRVYFICE